MNISDDWSHSDEADRTEIQVPQRRVASIYSVALCCWSCSSRCGPVNLTYSLSASLSLETNTSVSSLHDLQVTQYISNRSFTSYSMYIYHVSVMKDAQMNNVLQNKIEQILKTVSKKSVWVNYPNIESMLLKTQQHSEMFLPKKMNYW